MRFSKLVCLSSFSYFYFELILWLKVQFSYRIIFKTCSLVDYILTDILLFLILIHINNFGKIFFCKNFASDGLDSCLFLWYTALSEKAEEFLYWHIWMISMKWFWLGFIYLRWKPFLGVISPLHVVSQYKQIKNVYCYISTFNYFLLLEITTLAYLLFCNCIKH